MSTVTSQTIVPESDGHLIVTIIYDAQKTGGGTDFGPNAVSKPFCTQSGATVYGNAAPISLTRMSQTVRGVFEVVGGSSCEFGLFGGLGIATVSWWNIHITAELIKR